MPNGVSLFSDQLLEQYEKIQTHSFCGPETRAYLAYLAQFAEQGNSAALIHLTNFMINFYASFTPIKRAWETLATNSPSTCGILAKVFEDGHVNDISKQNLILYLRKIAHESDPEKLQAYVRYLIVYCQKYFSHLNTEFIIPIKPEENDEAERSRFFSCAIS